MLTSADAAVRCLHWLQAARLALQDSQQKVAKMLERSRMLEQRQMGEGSDKVACKEQLTRCHAR